MQLFASHNITQAAEGTADRKPVSRRSTTISMMEEEFGMRTPPQAAGRFGESNIHHARSTMTAPT